MLNFLKDWFSKPVEQKTIQAKPLRYLIGADIPRIDRNAIIEVSYNTNYKINDDDIAYCNLFDEENSGKYGPYLHSSDTAEQYNEGQIDPSGSGWERNLREQFQRRTLHGFNYIELDNPDAYRTADVLQAVRLAGTYNLKVIAKNPSICDDPVSYVKHPNIYGIIVEKDCGTPDGTEVLRQKAGRPNLPVWFVCFGSGKSWGVSMATQASKYKFMGVTYSSVGEYGNSIDILKPTS